MKKLRNKKLSKYPAVALSGSFGSGKTTLATALSRKLGWKQAAFGKFIRYQAKIRGYNPNKREDLQKVGSILIKKGWLKFCKDVLHYGGWKIGEPVIINGIRHVQAIKTLRKILSPMKIVHIYLDLNRQEQRKRLFKSDKKTLINLGRLEKDKTECEVRSKLPLVADKILRADIKKGQLVNKITELIY